MNPELSHKKLKVVPFQVIESANGILIRRGATQVRIGGEKAINAVEMLLAITAQGAASPREICSYFAQPDRPAVETLIEHMVAQRLLVSEDVVVPPEGQVETPLEVLYWHFDQRTAQVIERLDRHAFIIVGVNAISRQLATALRASSVPNVQVIDYQQLRNLRYYTSDGHLRDEEWPLPKPLLFRDWASPADAEKTACIVATSDFGGLQLMRQWNEYCVRRHIHFLPVVLQDLVGYIGPLVVPGETACLECCRARQNSHVDNPALYRAAESAAADGQAVVAYHPSMASVLGDLAAIELLRFYMAGLPLGKPGRLTEVNLAASQMSSHKVLKVPRCGVCSPMNTSAPCNPEKNIFLPGNPVES